MSACNRICGELTLINVQTMKMRHEIQELLALEGLPEGTKGRTGLTARELVRLLETDLMTMAVAVVAAWDTAKQCAPPPAGPGRVVPFPGGPGHHPGPSEGTEPTG